MKRLQHSLSIGSNAWHARWYRYWLSLGGTEPEYKENLCHYVRVLVFWAPSRWFWQGKIKGTIAPWLATLLTALVAFSIVAAFVWPDKSLDFWLSIAGIAGIVMVGLALLVAIGGLSESEKAQSVVLAVTMPIWILPYAFCLAGERLWEMVDDGVEAIVRWFFKRSYLIPHLSPAVMVGIVAMAVLTVLFTAVMLKIYLWVALFTLASAAFVAAMVGISMLDEWAKHREKSNKPNRAKRWLSGAADTIKLGATYANTKKQGSRICPFIELEPPAEPNVS